MGIFDRIKNVVKGTAEGVVSGIEERNPEAVYDAAVDGQAARASELKSRAAGVVAQRDREMERVAALEREADQLAVALRGALDEDDDETALVLQMRRQEVDDELETRRATVLTLEHQVGELKAGVVAAGDSAVALKREKDVQLAQKAVAEAQIDLQDAASGLSDDPSAKALDTVRERIGRMEAQAHEGFLDGDGNSVRARVEKLSRQGAEDSARQQLEALKAQRGRGSEAPPAEVPDDDGDDGDGPGGRSL